jgi:hypothetical protein
VREYLLPPLPNTLYTRDTTCWLYGGVTLNPLHWPARKEETLLYKAFYDFHPDFVGSRIWWGDPDEDWGQASFEGADIMPVGNGVVLMGMSERTSRQAITQVAAALVAQGAAERVIVAGMPKLRAAMHLDTVFTFADRDVVTLYPTIMEAVHPFTLVPADAAPGVEVVDEGSTPFVDVVARALGLSGLRVIETGGDARPRRRPLHDLPDHPRAGRLLRSPADETPRTTARRAGGVGSVRSRTPKAIIRLSVWNSSAHVVSVMRRSPGRWGGSTPPLGLCGSGVVTQRAVIGTTRSAPPETRR